MRTGKIGYKIFINIKLNDHHRSITKLFNEDEELDQNFITEYLIKVICII